MTCPERFAKFYCRQIASRSRSNKHLMSDKHHPLSYPRQARKVIRFDRSHANLASNVVRCIDPKRYLSIREITVL